ncbi:MAG: hypothetical protein KGL31_07570 [candidate division NC10 bacterium]|nr:hypothetical protein [candidate division NC10 bacterium]MDE2321761.1 hypothetical protein [candidate division NC10 bacterium]
MSADLRFLLCDGLYAENLTKIFTICDLRFEEHPALYGALQYICSRLAEEYDSQAIPTDRYTRIMSELQTPLLALFDAASAPAETFLSRLNDALLAFKRLYA